MRPNQQMRELASRRSRLRQEFRDRSLKQVGREKKRGLKWNPCRATYRLFAADRGKFRVLIEKPHWFPLEDVRDQGEYRRRRTPTATFNHAEIGHRRRRLWINLGTAVRQIFKRYPVLFSKSPQLHPEEVVVPDDSFHLSPV